ncbi:MAG: hypothetical protein DI603_19425 [Roseateles depolymerans]|uniref:FG-GAP repeat protein n=1 Tax=Roseateles depolymerans TaxID=76731 RepID=A0A2W5DGR9_9BURK|nr:MAG: hypothetical protein DI603_19425 [Roseateles depolymerans]
MHKWLGQGAHICARMGIALATLVYGAGAQAWSATRLPEITIPGGGALSAQVDLNRDGYKDLISTAPGENHRGVVEVRYGSAKGFKQKADFRYEGAMDWAQVGSSPMALDVNGDGWPDLIVGAYTYSGSVEYAGAILVFFGGPNGFSQTPSQIIEGPEANSFFGFTMRSLGDFNHDGFADLAVSSNTAGGTQGKIFIYTGSRAGLVVKPDSTLAYPMMSWWDFGRSFDAGDASGDGIADIAVGSATSAGGGRPGLAFIYKGSAAGYSNRPDETLVAPDYVADTDQYGLSVSVLGDVDGDGFPEIAVSAPNYLPPTSSGDTVSPGRIFVYYGSAAGFNASGRMQMIGAPDADGFAYFGEVMLGQRDFNGDGYADLLVGASMRQRGLTGTLPFPGFLWVYTGGPGGFTKAPYKRSGAAGSVDGMGAIFDAADVTGDGQMDIITANPAAPSNPQGLLRVFRGAKGLK